MGVEFGANHNAGPNNGAHAGDEIAFAVVVTLSDHAAVKVERHDVHRPGGAQAIEQLVAQRFVGVAANCCARVGFTVQAPHHVQSELAGVDRHVAAAHRVAHLVATQDAAFREVLQADRDG